MSSNDVEDQFQDRMAIRDLLDTYHGAINLRDWNVLESVFTREAQWNAAPPINLSFDGRDAILTGLKSSVGRQELLVQSSSGILIEFITPASASVRSTLSEFGKTKETGEGWRAIAVYSDHVVKERGEWRFQRRSLELKYQGESPAPGEVVGAPSN